MKNHIEKLILTALSEVQTQHQITIENIKIQIDNTKDKKHGDLTTNIALLLGKQMNPRELAKIIVNALPPSTNITKVEIAGPGFINFFLTPQAQHSVIKDILAQGEKFGHTTKGQGHRVIVEFVSSNPTGPLHVGHGRHAAFGAVVSDLLAAQGFNVYKEYYINDAGRQMDILAVSVWLRYLMQLGETFPFPDNGYKGHYVNDIASKLFQTHAKEFSVTANSLLENLPKDEKDGGDKEIYIDAVIERAKTLLGENKYKIILNHSLELILDDIRSDLAEFGVRFDNWLSEKSFVESQQVDRIIQELIKKGYTYEREGALWFRSTDFQDEKDRVLQRKNGQRTYFANDLAYHINKFERGFDRAIDVFGSDHHGYVPRMKAGLQAWGIPGDKLTYVLLQFVTLFRGGQQAQMSTRSGSFVTLRELRDEVGNDAARFFYVMRKSDQHVDFDLDLAKSQSNENPVYYIQYAHARICSVFRQLPEKKQTYSQEEGCEHLDLLTQPQEVQLIALLVRYPEAIEHAARQFEPHSLTQYLRELAASFHGYYNTHQFLVEETDLRNARLVLIQATRQVLANGLKLLGVSAPDTM